MGPCMGSGICSLGCGILGLGFYSGLRVRGLGFTAIIAVSGFGFRVSCLGRKAEGLKVGV
jgi:hypothetical protein